MVFSVPTNLTYGVVGAEFLTEISLAICRLQCQTQNQVWSIAV